MSYKPIRPENLDRILSKEDKDERDAVIASNEAFIARLKTAVRRGKERAMAGTFVDTTPPIGAVFVRAIPEISACGSPSAMCIERGNPDGGAPLALKS